MDQFIPESPITFHRQLGGSGIELTEVLDDNLDDLVGRNDPMFSNYTGLSISLRLEVQFRLSISCERARLI